jgi:hypothetical protein
MNDVSSPHRDVHWKFYPMYLENMQHILKKTPPHRTSILLLYNFYNEDDQLESTSKAPSDLAKPMQASSSDSLSSFWSTLVNSSSDSGSSSQLIKGDRLGGQCRRWTT